jgi:hypothetical protein
MMRPAARARSEEQRRTAAAAQQKQSQRIDRKCSHPFATHASHTTTKKQHHQKKFKQQLQ